VTVTEHVPAGASVHVDEENVTLPAPACDQVIVSPVTEPENPVTVAVQEVPEHVTAVVVVAFTTVKPTVPELSALLTSPL